MAEKDQENDKFMEDITPPNVKVWEHQEEFRATLLNTRKSALAGLVLLVLPFLFLSGVVLKHYLQIDFGLFTYVYEWIGAIDQAYGDDSWINWIIRIFLFFGPLAAVAINLMALMHIRYHKPRKELVMSIKFKLWNWLLIGLCSLFFLIFFSYLITENLLAP